MTGERYRDGQTVRRDRVLDLIGFVEECQNVVDQCYQTTIETHMFLKFGSTRKWTQGILHELELANVLKVDKNGVYHTRMTIMQMMGLISPNSVGMLPDSEGGK